MELKLSMLNIFRVVHGEKMKAKKFGSVAKLYVFMPYKLEAHTFI